MLTQMEQRLRERRTFEAVIEIVLDDVIALHGAEFGNVQLVVGSELVIVAQRGLSPLFLKAFKPFGLDDGCACGRASRLGKSITVMDVCNDPEFAGFRRAVDNAGVRSVQSTPLRASDGKMLGMYPRILPMFTYQPQLKCKH